MLNGRPVVADSNHDAKRVALELALDLRRPIKPRWPNAGLNSWVTRQDAGLAAPRHGWRVAAAHGFKTVFGHTEPRRGVNHVSGPYTLFKSEPPSGGTLSGRYRRNGYVHGPTVLTVRPSSRASPLPHLDRVVSFRESLAVRPSREQAPSPQGQRRTEVV